MAQPTLQAPAASLSPRSHVELSVPDPSWTFSTYHLNDHRLHIEHPNTLGTTTETGRDHELRRFRRFRERYISKHLRDVLVGRQRVLKPPCFRAHTTSEMLAKCNEKTCFRRDEFPPAPNMRGDPSSIQVGNEVPSLVERSRLALEAATEYYGVDVISDLQLGFTRTYRLNDDRIPQLPLIADAIGALDDQGGHHDTLSLVISYRHSTQKEGYILNVDPDVWPSLLLTMQVLCRQAGCSRFRLWTDQILSFRKPQAPLRWVSSGVLPYTVYPVVYLFSSTIHDDLNRMWISIEHLAASFGQGLIHVGESLPGEVCPKEWLSTYVEVIEGDTRLTWLTGWGGPMHHVVSKVCGVIMCGLLRNKELSWPLDAQQVIEWASAVTTTALWQDIAHTFICDDCKSPAGYTSQCRMGALLCSASPVYPTIPEALCNKGQPRPNVPALRLRLDGGSWDGFREWIPESCMWGLSQDQLSSTRRAVAEGTKAFVASDGGPRAVAVLQYAQVRGDGVLVAYMLVGLAGEKRWRRKTKAVWSKRFWPVAPEQMWKEFARLYANTKDRDALDEVAVIVGASSGLDYTNISDAQEIRRVKMTRVKW